MQEINMFHLITQPRTALLALVALCTVPTTTVAQSLQTVDLYMYADPVLTGPTTQWQVPNAPVPLWFKALERNDAQLQRVTVDTFALAKKRGMEGLDDVVPKLAELVSNDATDAEVRQAAVRALIEFDARDQSALLAEAASTRGLAVARIVEPALVQWKSPVMQQVWLDRVNQKAGLKPNEGPGDTDAQIIVAIEGLLAVSADEAAEALWELVRRSELKSVIRLAAADTLGKLTSPDLSAHAAELVASQDSDPLAALLALRLLVNQQDASAVATLQTLAKNPISAVQSGALDRLFRIDHQLVLPYCEEAIKSSDVNVRRTVAKTLTKEAKVELIASLAMLLDDVNPKLRRQMAGAMVHLAKRPALKDEVIAQSHAVLSENSWRGCEQATTVLVSLDHKPAGDRLVELLDHPRPEVMSTAAWGLRKLAIPRHLPAMLEQGQQQFEAFNNGSIGDLRKGAVQQLAQLFMAFGQMRYFEADGLLRAYIPKNHSLGEDSRAAAAYALGFLHEGKATGDLTGLMVQRLNDTEADFPESDKVRRNVAIALGRMKSESALPDLRKYGSYFGEVGLASAWSIHLMTGEPRPTPGVTSQVIDDWFLSPIK